MLQECQSLDIQFHLVRGDPKQVIPDFIKDWNVGALVADFTPLRLPLQWIESISKQLPPDVPFIQVCSVLQLTSSQHDQQTWV